MEPLDIRQTAEQLIALGEDREELNYWLQIYPDLSEEKQAMLYVNLQQELESLRRI